MSYAIIKHRSKVRRPVHMRKYALYKWQKREENANTTGVALQAVPVEVICSAARITR